MLQRLVDRYHDPRSTCSGNASSQFLSDPICALTTDTHHMEFILTYRGPLKANGSPSDKQVVRRAVHKPMQQLWKQNPLVQYTDTARKQYYLEDDPPVGSTSLIQRVGGLRLAPLVSPKLFLIAELSITFLRPEAPGAIITAGGDIDKPYEDSPRCTSHAEGDQRIAIGRHAGSQ